MVWHCPICGDNGIIRGWEGTFWDNRADLPCFVRDDDHTREGAGTAPSHRQACWRANDDVGDTSKSTEAATSPPTVWEEPNAVQIHVALNEMEPPIWRRLVVPLDTTLAQLHYILQAAMGWTDSHLHQFEIGGLRYGDPDLLNLEIPDDFQQAFDAGPVRLRDFDFDHDGKLSFIYTYDFGDSWRHTVTLEKLLAIKPAPKAATCIEGARSCPPEDVGGTHGYFEFLRVLLSPDPDEIEEQRDLKRWSGGRFDPERFDVAKTDKALRGALRKRREK